MNLWVLPNEFCTAFDLARRQGIPLDEAEHQTLGFTHCEAGMLIAEQWRLSPDLSATVSLHHKKYESVEHAALIAVLELSDLLCRMSGLDYGYIENREVNLLKERGFGVLSKRCPQLQNLDWARLTFELESYMDEVHSLVHAIYRK